MSWFFRPTFKDNKELINHLVKQGIIRTKSVISAMMKVDRNDFAPTDPYNDAPQFLGHNATISAPHMHGYALEYLQSRLKPGMSVLDVGSGSGILCAYMAHMVLEQPDTQKNEPNQPKNGNQTEEKKQDIDVSDSSGQEQEQARVVGIEHIQELVDMSVKNIKKNAQHKEWLQNEKIVIIKGDGRLGYPKYAPYDCIHVGAAAQPSVVETLFNQLKEGGILVIPVEIDSDIQHQVFRIYEKDVKYKNKETNKYDIDKCCKDLLDVMYVPLTEEKKQRTSRIFG